MIGLEIVLVVVVVACLWCLALVVKLVDDVDGHGTNAIKLGSEDSDSITSSSILEWKYPYPFDCHNHMMKDD